MAKLIYDIRNYRADDFEEFVRFHREIKKQGSSSPAMTWTIVERLQRPHYNPTQDLFLATAGKNIIGYLDVSRETGIDRIVLVGEINPAERRKGIATSLLNQALHYGSTTGIQRAHVNICEENVAAIELLHKLGFRLARRFIEFSLRLTDSQIPVLPETALSCRSLRYGEEQVLTDLQNRVFAGTWGFNPNTKEDIIHCLKLQGCSHHDVILLVKEDSIIGYCWTVPQINETHTSDGKTSRIYMLGVAPEHRRQGAGKLLLSAGLCYLKERETHSVVLTADSENTTACMLYLAAGFKATSTSLWYEKSLPCRAPFPNTPASPGIVH
jgi:mycothiol synthase